MHERQMRTEKFFFLRNLHRSLNFVGEPKPKQKLFKKKATRPFYINFE